MSRYISIFLGSLTFFIIASLIIAGPVHAEAKLYLEPASITATVGGELTPIKVMLNTGAEYINTVAIGVDYPADQLELVSVNTLSDIIAADNWTETNTAVAGQIRYTGFTNSPYKSTTSDGGLISLVFKAIDSGTAPLEFNSTYSKVHRDDAVQTDILGTTTGAQVIITTAAVTGSSTTVTNTPTATPTPDLPASGVVENTIFLLILGFGLILGGAVFYPRD